MTLADRVHADDDEAPLQAAKQYPQEIEKVIHFSGKARDIQDFEKFLQDAKTRGQKNLLLLTGDKLKQHHYSQDQRKAANTLFGVRECCHGSQTPRRFSYWCGV